MNMKILSIQIKCNTNNVSISFSPKISIIYGNAGVGKTTLLNLINFVLGNDLIKTLAVEEEVLSAGLNILLEGEMIYLERKVNSNSIVMIRENDTEILYANNMKSSYRHSFSDFLYEIEDLQPLEMLRKKSARKVRVTFSNFMWFSYLRQEELDNTLFYLGDKTVNYKGFASNYVMKSLLGESDIYNTEVDRELIKLTTRKEMIKEKISVMREICTVSKLFQLNFGEEIARQKKEAVVLKNRIEKDKQRLLRNDNPLNEMEIDDLLDKQRKLGVYEVSSKYLIEFGKINEINNKYYRELNECIDEINRLKDLKIASDNEFFKNNLRQLGKIFFQCLLDIRFSYIDHSDYVEINERSFEPSIYSKYGEYKFSYYNLSSGGKKTIFKICYAIAIHIFAIQNKIKSILPDFIMIDTPMKNISEREDRILYENLYRYLLKLFSPGGDLYGVQLIIVDKEMPEILEQKDIMKMHMTNENPLIPNIKKER